MANPITLSIGIISLTAIPFTLVGRTATDVLLATNLKVKKLSGADFADFTDFTISNATALAGTITPNSTLAEGDLILIQVDDGSQKSDRVSVDFSESYAGNDAITPFLLPSEPGNYTLNVQTVNEENFSAIAASREFTVGNKPDTASSSIALDYKPYLVKYVGLKVNVNIKLQNATTNAADGNYEVIFKATKTN